MKHGKRPFVAQFLLAAALLAGCQPKQPVEVAATEPPRPEPVVPEGYKKIAPAPLDSSEQMLSQTATIFRGVLKDVRFTFDDCAGPRTNYVFSDSSSLAGTLVPSEVTVKVLGGPTPGGGWIEVSEIPQLALDAEYVAFLRNTDWTFSPVVGNLVFRREMIAGREVLIDPTGRAVIGWGEDGPLLSAAPVSEAVGRQLRGYRGAEAPAQTAQPRSAGPDPRPDISPATGNPPAAASGRDMDSAIAGAPSLADTRRAGLFVKPAVSAAALANEPAVSVESLVAAVKVAAERERVNIGGRITLNPYWRCWSAIPTAGAAR